MNASYEGIAISSAQDLRELLSQLADPTYRTFHRSLVPGLENFYGVRTPALKQVAKALLKTDPMGFLEECPADSYEEKMLRAMVIGGVKTDRETLLRWIEEFIPLVDNWAVCDGFCTYVKGVKKDLDGFFPAIRRMVQADAASEPYRVRVGLVFLLKYYLVPAYLEESLRLCDQVVSEHYYVNMAQAWLVATAMGADSQKTMAYLDHCHLNGFTYSKAIQKALESYLVDDSTKEMLKWKRKNLKKEGQNIL